MNKDDIKPEDHPDIAGGWIWTDMEIRWIKKQIADAVAAEREACAKVCEELLRMVSSGDEHMDGVTDCIEAIRARSGEREHDASSDCWCNPELDYKDPDTGAEVWVHKEPQ